MKGQKFLAQVLLCLFVSSFIFGQSSPSGLYEIEIEIMRAADRMKGPDVNTGNLIKSNFARAKYEKRDEDGTANLDALAGYADPEIRFWYFTLGHPLYPFSRVQPLKYGSGIKIVSLLVKNFITTEIAAVHIHAMIATRKGNTVTIRSAFAISSAYLNEQYHVQKVRKCRTILLWEDCWEEDDNVQRGLYHTEIEAIIQKLHREGAIAVVNKVKEVMGYVAAPQNGLSATSFVDENLKLRQLYKQLEYDLSEVNSIQPEELMTMIKSLSRDQITDAFVLNKIQQIASSTYRSCFLVAPSPNFFFVFGVVNQNGSYSISISTFKVEGRLPVGAFLTSTGTWNIERYGEGASPSLHQIMSIFPAMRA